MKQMKKISTLLFLVFFAYFFTGLTLFANNGANEGGKYLPFAEQMPKPVGGIKALYKKVVYPEIAQKAGVEGKVYLLAFIDENGNVEDVKVIKGIGAGCDEAAINAVKASKFIPGKSKGKPVKVKMSLQFKFKL